MAVEVKNKVAEINIEGEIGWYEWDGEKWVANTASAIRQELKRLMELEVDEIVVNIHSLGGFIDDGIAIHDALASHPAKVTTIVTGFTASAATVIAQAGDVRKISANAMYLVHEAWGVSIGTSEQMMETVEFLDTLNDKMADLYARRAKKDKEKYRSLMAERAGAGKWITAEEAESFGLVDEVYEPMKAAAAVLEFNKAEALGLSLPDTVKSEMETSPIDETPTEEEIEKLAPISGVQADQSMALANAKNAEMLMLINL